MRGDQLQCQDDKTTKDGHPFYQEQRPITDRVTAADLDRMPDFELKYPQ
jgi:hypothetical protein